MDNFDEKVAQEILKPIGIVQIIGWLIMLVSLFVWLWLSWSIAWKVFATGFIISFSVGLIGDALKKMIIKKIKSQQS